MLVFASGSLKLKLGVYPHFKSKLTASAESAEKTSRDSA